MRVTLMREGGLRISRPHLQIIIRRGQVDKNQPWKLFVGQMKVGERVGKL